MPKLCSQYGVIPATSAETLLEELHTRCGAMVHGRGKHKSQLQRGVESLYQSLIKSLMLFIAPKARKRCYEYITGAMVSSERSDHLTLIPLLQGMEQHLGANYADVTCNAGYESEESYTYFENTSTTCYIKPQNYERSKAKKFKSNMVLRENMKYDSVLDEYTCQNGKKLCAVYEGKRKSKSDFESTVTYYECEDCTGCPYKKELH